MKTKKYHSKRFRKIMWRYDFTDHRGKRSRIGGFATRADAEEALSVRLNRDYKQRHGVFPRGAQTAEGNTNEPNTFVYTEGKEK